MMGACRKEALSNKRYVAMVAMVIGLSGCESYVTGSSDSVARSTPPLISVPAAQNVTPYDPAFACLENEIASSGSVGLKISAGEIADLTGKYIESEGGSIVTKGGAHMVMSALGKLDDVITPLERYDTSVADKELQYIDRRQLGDGQKHSVPGEEEMVPWKPYFGGTVIQSDYHILGAITEVNFNMSSQGAEVAVAGVGFKASQLTMGVAVDLRIVGSQTLKVYDTVSVKREIIGQHVGAEVFRFFGDSLFDFNVGARSQEPIQLAVRTALDLAVFELIESITGVDGSSCVAAVERDILVRALKGSNGA